MTAICSAVTASSRARHRGAVAQPAVGFGKPVRELPGVEDVAQFVVHTLHGRLHVHRVGLELEQHNALDHGRAAVPWAARLWGARRVARSAGRNVVDVVMHRPP